MKSTIITLSLVSLLSGTFVPQIALARPQTGYKSLLVTLSDLDGVIFGSDLSQVAGEIHEPAVDPRVQPLRKYLESKNSPMAPYAYELLKNYHYRLIIGISFAESNFCKRNIRPHNCWGIGGGKPEQYKDYPAAFERANQLIQKYHNSGLTSPKLMRDRWVGWKNDGWIRAVNQVTKALEEQGI